jgi:thymidylate synthase
VNYHVEQETVTNAKTVRSLDELQLWALSSLLNRGRTAEPRGLETLELLGVTCTLTNPRNRCIANPERRWNLALAVGEFCWHASASNSVEFIEYYARRWREFTEDGSTIRGSCYGHTVFGQLRSGPSQWQQIVALLRRDPESRRAILSFREPSEDLFADKDVPCANTMQFLVRDSRLHAVVSMRSNDVIWGLPYDLFLFTMFQELLASELGLALGAYTHMVGSLHLYEKHYELARRIIAVPDVPVFEMPQMEEYGELHAFLDLEARLRTGPSVDLEEKKSLNPYWQDLFAVLKWFRRAKDDGGYEKALEAAPGHSPYRTFLSNFVDTQTQNIRRYAKQSAA